MNVAKLECMRKCLGSGLVLKKPIAIVFKSVISPARRECKQKTEIDRALLLSRDFITNENMVNGHVIATCTGADK